MNCSANKTFKNIHRALCIQRCVHNMVRLYACRSCMICTAFKIAYLGMTMPCAKKSQKKTSFVPFAVKLVVCASFKGDAHCAKMCGCIHTSFGGCARGAEQAISISSVDDIVHAKSYAFQKACLSHHPLMMSCIQRAMPIAHTFKASMCKKCPRAKVLTSMGRSPSIQIFTGCGRYVCREAQVTLDEFKESVPFHLPFNLCSARE